MIVTWDFGDGDSTMAGGGSKAGTNLVLTWYFGDGAGTGVGVGSEAGSRLHYPSE